MSTAQSCSVVRVAVATVLASATLAGATQAQDFPSDSPSPLFNDDPVVFSFATVGDSRTEDTATGGAPDPTTLLEAGEPGTFSSGASLGTPSQSGKPDLTGTLLPQDATFLTNTKSLARILRGVQREKPNLLFFNGDMIYGYGRPAVVPAELAGITTVQGRSTPGSATPTTALVWTDAVFEYRQYAYWRGIVAPLFETGTYVVPVPGNHETQCSPKTSHDSNDCLVTGDTKTKHAYPENEAAFKDNVGDLVEDIYTNERFQTVSGFPAIAANGFLAGTAPQAGGNNGKLTGVATPNPTGEAELSYSFDIKLDGGHQLLHFVIINTDPAGSDATAPTDWLAQDLEDAKDRAAANNLNPKYFVFGHKPAFTYGYNVVTAAPASAYTPYAANGLDLLTANVNTTAAPSSVSVKDANGNTVTIATNVEQLIADTKPQQITSQTSYPLVNLFWAVIAHYNATYFCGHEHIPHVERFKDITGGSKNTPYQVIVGSGGSPFDDAMSSDAPPREPVPLVNWQDRYYGWATVQVHRSGNVTLQVEGFTDGAQYDPTTGVVSKLGVETPARVLYSVPNLP